MRKYYQAALAITAVVSLVSLLFYRHEYNKLRYVLEVFNYFGKPNQKDVQTNCTNISPIFSKFNMKFEEPRSSWQRLDDNLYVYSAYSIREQEVQAIGFGSVESIKDMKCIVFFENEAKPVQGNFKYIPIDSDFDTSNTKKSSEYNGYHFLCAFTQTKVPVGITFLTDPNINLMYAPILPVKIQPKSLNYSNIAVCAIPPLIKQMSPLEMISFINFHDLIGMNNFIVYDFGVPSNVNNYLKDMSVSQNPYWKFTYTVIPWNFPYFNVDRNVIRDVIQADCLYRTYNKALYVATLSWEEYMVLKYHHTVIDLLTDFKRSKLKANRYKLTTLTFCTQQTDNTRAANSTLTIFKKTRFDPSITESYSIHIYSPYESLQKTSIFTREIGKDLVALNRYRHCSEQSNSQVTTHDSSILRFFEDVQNSPIFRKFLAEHTLSSEKQ